MKNVAFSINAFKECHKMYFQWLRSDIGRKEIMPFDAQSWNHMFRQPLWMCGNGILQQWQFNLRHHCYIASHFVGSHYPALSVLRLISNSLPYFCLTRRRKWCGLSAHHMWLVFIRHFEWIGLRRQRRRRRRQRQNRHQFEFQVHTINIQTSIGSIWKCWSSYYSPFSSTQPACRKTNNSPSVDSTIIKCENIHAQNRFNRKILAVGPMPYCQ